MKNPVRVGVTGLARAGKSEALRHLSNVYGFKIVSPSSIIQDELRRIYGDREFSRDEMREMGTVLKRMYGPAFAVEIALLDPSERVSVDGIRNLAAAERLLQSGGHLFGYVADPGVRFERDSAADDGKAPSPDLETFLAEEAPEMDSQDPYGMQILRVLGITPRDHIIDTTHLNIPEANALLDRRLGALGIGPIADPYGAVAA